MKRAVTSAGILFTPLIVRLSVATYSLQASTGASTQNPSYEQRDHVRALRPSRLGCIAAVRGALGNAAEGRRGPWACRLRRRCRHDHRMP